MIGPLLAAVLWTAPVTTPPEPAAAWLAAQVPGWLEAVEGGDVTRVRLLDGEGVEVPYRLVEPSATSAGGWFQPPVLNLVGSRERLAADLLNPELRVLDRLRIDLGEGEGVLAVTVSLADGPEAGAVLARGVHVGRLQGVVVQEVPLPPTDAARLHVRGETVLAGWTVSGFRLHGAASVGSDPTKPVALRANPAADADGWQAWDLTAPGTVRLDAVDLEVGAPPVFRRRAQVLGWDARTSAWRTVGEGTVARVPLGDGRTGLEQGRVELAPGAFPRLRLLVEQGDERPLVLEAVAGRTAPRFAAFPAQGWRPPLELVRGDVPRSRSLEGGPGLDLRAAAPAAVGARTVVAETDAADAPEPGRRRLGDLLFVAAALLLGLLAWRVLRPSSPGDAAS